METWKPIPFAPQYEASDAGRIRHGEKILSPWKHDKRKANSYLRVNVGGRERYVHVCVMAAFHGEMPLCDVNHKYGIKSDNRLSELEYTTRAGNMADAVRQGLCEKTRKVAGELMKRRWIISASTGAPRPGIKLEDLSHLF